ncbi:iron ABC transporter permease [Actinomyces sp. 2119]|uniref:FecCD family ABC transporter permease n=1 Tax=Actinomyces sp. 2119 TaxID=2321393 RepID=UPI000E6CF0AD|nr:iron chelate uptake ABC transporter family permease subunit [Actinomyces sp. 2119]RJF40981.1 iron ABC transporter permease [Actinomyces sp. 2119]
MSAAYPDSGRSVPGYWWLRLPTPGRAGCSLLLTPRHLLVGTVLTLLCLVTAVLALRTGAIPLDYSQIGEVLAGGGSRGDRVVVLRWRLPRIALGVVAGAALGVAGQLFQVVTRNPLGSPDLIGFSMGAQTGILVSVLVLPGTALSVLSVSLASLLGGLGVGTGVFLLSVRGGFAGMRLVLAGIAISSMLSSVNRWLLLRVDQDTAFGALRTSTGTLSAATWQVTVPTFLGVLAVLVLLAPLARQARMLPLGDDLAAALGTRVGRLRTRLVLLGTALVALVTMAVGPVGFVALVSPHLARLTARAEVPPVYVTGAVGALLLLGSDVVSQRLLASMPVGVTTGAVGGTYLMCVLVVAARRRRG